MTGKVTKRSVETIRAADKDVFLWDTELPGFGCKVTPAGRRVYVLQTYVTGRLRRLTIAPHGNLTAEQARQEALRLVAGIATGQDPAATRREARQAPTVSELADRYLTDHAELHKKPGSVRQDRATLKLYVRPVLGSKLVPEVTREDVARLHYRLRATPYMANRVLALVSVMFNLAERWGLRQDGTNPTRHVKKFREQKRERFLSADELAALGAQLKAVERTRKELPSVVAAIRLLIFTGARLNEILTARWEYVDFEHECLRLPDSKTGAKVVHLSTPALDVLGSLKRNGSQWIIAGRKVGSHLVNLEKPWRRIRDDAKLPDVRLHDLRHSYASVAAGQGNALPIIGKLLGHTQAQTTARYAHLADDPVRKAANAIGAEIAATMRRPVLRVVK